MKLYGIPNCNTVKTARTWLESRAETVEFHDFKKHGVPAENLSRWLQVHGWETVVNRRGTTWRGLDEAVRNSIIDNASAHEVLLKYPSLIKRPVLEIDDRIFVGFDEAAYEELIK